MAVVKGITAGWQSMFRGEVPQYTELLEDSRRHDAAAPTEQERERLAVALRRHLADGRLDLEQFDVQVAQLYRASTRREAREALDGLPLLNADPSGPTARTTGRRHGETHRIAPHRVATAEVFRDPSSGRVMRVRVDPTDGSQHYGDAG